MEEKELIDLYNSIDIDKENCPKIYKVDSKDDVQKYFKNASESTLILIMKAFKEQVYLLSLKDKYNYIESLNIPNPQIVKSENKDFNQTVFTAKSAFYNFIQSYKRHLVLEINEHKSIDWIEKIEYKIENIETEYQKFINKFPDADKGYFEKQELSFIENEIKEPFTAENNPLWIRYDILLDKYKKRLHEFRYDIDNKQSKDFDEIFNECFDNKTLEEIFFNNEHYDLLKKYINELAKIDNTFNIDDVIPIKIKSKNDQKWHLFIKKINENFFGKKLTDNDMLFLFFNKSIFTNTDIKKLVNKVQKIKTK